MSILIRKNFIVILLVASFLGISVFHLFSMSSGQTMLPNVCFGIVTDSSCPLASEGTSSFSHHLNALQSFLQVVPRHSENSLLGIFVITFLLGSLLFVLLSKERSRFISLRVRHRRLWELIFAFHYEIGSWLKLLGKRDPAHNPLRRGFEFTIIPIQ